MIFGAYPCCDGSLALGVPDKTPAWLQDDCPHCGTPVWHRISRLDPESWTSDEFEAIFDIDYENRLITRKDGKDTEIRVRQ